VLGFVGVEKRSTNRLRMGFCGGVPSKGGQAPLSPALWNYALKRRAAVRKIWF